jgi:hypothetical protein
VGTASWYLRQENNIESGKTIPHQDPAFAPGLHVNNKIINHEGNEI